MNTYIAYFDETGDDGFNTSSCEHFILTSIYMPSYSWQNNFNLLKKMKSELKCLYGFHVSQEIHTKHFLTDKNPYRTYNWDKETKQKILKKILSSIAVLDIKIINVIIDKTKIKTNDYSILENALKYNIQRIDNDSNGSWNYLIITDRGRIAPMRKTARAIRAFNPIHSKYSCDYLNKPICNLIEDILEKDSKESYFIQIADFISYFVHLYFDTCIKGKDLPHRVSNVIDKCFIINLMDYLKSKDKFNLKASKNDYGLVIYPK